MKIKFLTTTALLTMLISGCADKIQKEKDNFNKPAAFWYKKIIKNARSGELDKADDAYTSLSSEHVASPLLAPALLTLAREHSANEEHLLAKFYLDSYIKRYAKSSNIEYLNFLKLKSNYQALKKAKRDQKLIIDTISDAQNYIKKYPTSIYNPLVNTMITKLYLAELSLNRDIANLYKKTGKNKAAKIYEDKISSSWLKNINIENSNQGYLGKIFD